MDIIDILIAKALTAKQQDTGQDTDTSVIVPILSKTKEGFVLRAQNEDIDALGYTFVKLSDQFIPLDVLTDDKLSSSIMFVPPSDDLDFSIIPLVFQIAPNSVGASAYVYLFDLGSGEVPFFVNVDSAEDKSFIGFYVNALALQQLANRYALDRCCIEWSKYITASPLPIAYGSEELNEGDDFPTGVVYLQVEDTGGE